MYFRLWHSSRDAPCTPEQPLRLGSINSLCDTRRKQEAMEKLVMEGNTLCNKFQDPFCHSTRNNDWHHGFMHIGNIHKKQWLAPWLHAHRKQSELAMWSRSLTTKARSILFACAWQCCWLTSWQNADCSIKKVLSGQKAINNCKDDYAKQCPSKASAVREMTLAWAWVMHSCTDAADAFKCEMWIRVTLQ